MWQLSYEKKLKLRVWTQLQTTMKTNVSRKTINTYIYLKKNHVINNKSADKQVHMMKASNNKNLFKSYCGFCTFHLTTKEKKPE